VWLILFRKGRIVFLFGTDDDSQRYRLCDKSFVVTLSGTKCPFFELILLPTDPSGSKGHANNIGFHTIPYIRNTKSCNMKHEH
jgi:hypothetical protein